MGVAEEKMVRPGAQVGSAVSCVVHKKQPEVKNREGEERAGVSRACGQVARTSVSVVCGPVAGRGPQWLQLRVGADGHAAAFGAGGRRAAQSAQGVRG